MLVFVGFAQKGQFAHKPTGLPKKSWLLAIVFILAVLCPICEGRPIAILNVSNFPQISKSRFSGSIENVFVFYLPIKVREQFALPNGISFRVVHVFVHVGRIFHPIGTRMEDRRQARYGEMKPIGRLNRIGYVDGGSFVENKCRGRAVTENFKWYLVKLILRSPWRNEPEVSHFNAYSGAFFADDCFDAGLCIRSVFNSGVRSSTQGCYFFFSLVYQFIRLFPGLTHLRKLIFHKTSLALYGDESTPSNKRGGDCCDDVNHIERISPIKRFRNYIHSINPFVRFVPMFVFWGIGGFFTHWGALGTERRYTWTAVPALVFWGLGCSIFYDWIFRLNGW